MTDKRKPHVIVLRLAVVLLILVMLSSSLVAGRFARYTSTVTASDSVKVAKFEVTEESALLREKVAVSIIPGGVDETSIVVTNASEVSVAYTIEVDNPYQNFPLSFQIEGAMPFTAQMAPGQTATYTLVTTWEGAADISYSGKVDLLEITVSATQID